MDSGANLQIANITLADAGTRYAFTCPTYTRAMSVQARPSIAINMYSSPTASDYWTVKAAGAYFESDIVFCGVVYFSSPSPDTVVEILTWNARV